MIPGPVNHLVTNLSKTNRVSTGFIPIGNDRCRELNTRQTQLRITSTTVEVVLGEWMQEAGIQKHITYHSSRHSAATLVITAGAELYSVSKILGHGSIASTQVYAKVNMEKKMEAMSLTDGVLG